MKDSKRSEEQIARAVVTELQRQGYVTYEEVSVCSGGYSGRRADIVAVRGPVLGVVECKTKFSLKLLDQMTKWIGQAHFVVGAVELTRLGVAAERYLKSWGLGLWSVGHSEISVKVSHRLLRGADVTALRTFLRPEMQSAEYAKAGTQGGHWTPFRGTCDALRALVRDQPGIELRAALKACGHHYASEKSALTSIPVLIRRGVIAGIRVEGERPLKLFPVSAPPLAAPHKENHD